jgi:hypothetical protein
MAYQGEVVLGYRSVNLRRLLRFEHTKEKPRPGDGRSSCQRC